MIRKNKKEVERAIKDSYSFLDTDDINNAKESYQRAHSILTAMNSKKQQELLPQMHLLYNKLFLKIHTKDMNDSISSNKEVLEKLKSESDKIQKQANQAYVDFLASEKEANRIIEDIKKNKQCIEKIKTRFSKELERIEDYKQKAGNQGSSEDVFVNSESGGEGSKKVNILRDIINSINSELRKGNKDKASYFYNAVRGYYKELSEDEKRQIYPEIEDLGSKF